MKDISSLSNLRELRSQNERIFVLLLKKGSESSDCAFHQLKEAAEATEEENVFSVDVSSVRDIHPAYNISTVPTLLVFKSGELINSYKGCNGKDFFKAVIESQAFSANTKDGERQPMVEVYSTPTCSWCTKLKSYLNKNHIRYSDINIAADPNIAEDLVRQTGQQGVPQTNIGGEWILGFDKKRIDQLLNINA